MPVSQVVLFVCPECGYKKNYKRGDALTFDDMFKKCPKCGAIMKPTNTEANTTNNIFDKLLQFLKGRK